MVIVGAMGVAACGGDDEAAEAPSSGSLFEVTSSVISAGDTQEIGVWAPDAEGSWPVVMGFHGYGGTQEAWDGLATELAKRGVVVFVPQYRSTSSVANEMKKDLVCGIHHARTVAGEYGGDLDQPYVLVGHSMGGSIVLGPLAEVREGTGGTLDACFEGLPDAPDAIVSMVGCHYESPDGSTGSPDRPVPGTPVTLVAGENDQTCEGWQSEDAAQALSEAGYDTTLVMIPGGTHGTPLFLDDSQEPWVPVSTDDPGGQQAVTAILDAIEAASG
jgi:dienelactone hydrolase